MIFICHLIIVLTQFEKSLEQPRLFDLNEFPTDEAGSSTPSVTDYQTELEMSFIEFYKNDQHKNWPELQHDILRHNVQQWTNFCSYLFNETDQKLYGNLNCVPSKYETSVRGFKIVYLHDKKKKSIAEIDVVQCICYKSSTVKEKPDYAFMVTKYSDSEYFLADTHSGNKNWKLMKFVRNVPASSLLAGVGDLPLYLQYKETHNL